MNVRIALTLSGLTLSAACPGAHAADTFNDLWLTRIKPPPYGGVATEFYDTVAADGKRLYPYRDKVCAHMSEPLGQRLRVTNVANGKSVVCTGRGQGAEPPVLAATRGRPDATSVQGDRLRRQVRSQPGTRGSVTAQAPPRNPIAST
jgi:hypothetical protein